jgi:hypothetical protein
VRPRDFTLSSYEGLLDAMQGAGYGFQTFTDHLRSPEDRAVLLRHDVDDRKSHSLTFARIQHTRGIAGTYYFRMVPQSFDERVVKEIHGLGHEVGYHYEEMDLCDGDPEKAYDLFRSNLDRLRAVVPVTSICMHGSPRSRYDNKDLWKRYDYRDHGIEGEPYLDLDFARVAYFTDTGRRWDGGAYSVRDHVRGGTGHRYRHTQEMARAVRQGAFPRPAMLNFHPQRWTDSQPLWWRDRMTQYAKNHIKYGIIKWRSLSAGSM